MLEDRYLDIDVGPLPFYRTRLRTNALLHLRPTRRLMSDSVEVETIS